MAAMLDRDQVLHVARLARLELDDDEVERMAGELSAVLDHVERIRELDLDGVPPTSHAVDVGNVTASRRAGARPAPRCRRWPRRPSPWTGGFGVPSPVRPNR